MIPPTPVWSPSSPNIVSSSPTITEDESKSTTPVNIPTFSSAPDKRPLLDTLNEIHQQNTDTSSLSPAQISHITNASTSHLKKHGHSTTELLNFICDGYQSSNSTSTTPDDRPTLMSSNKMHRFTILQLSRYFGFHSLKSWDTLYDVCKLIFSIIEFSDPPLDLGHVATRHLLTDQRISWKWFIVTYLMEISSLFFYCIMFVDRATCYSWIYPLLSIHHKSVLLSFVQWILDAGGFPKHLYTDFDSKILDGPAGQFLHENSIFLTGSLNGRQNQNGLVECTWQTVTNMAHAFIMDMQVPCSFWYWAFETGHTGFKLHTLYCSFYYVKSN